jgi:Ribosomal protein S13/S18
MFKNYFKLLSNYGINFYQIKRLYLLGGFSKTFYGKITFGQNIIFSKATERHKMMNNLAKYKKIKNYKGIRHLLKLPTRGQRTHTNANTAQRSKF